MADSQSTPMVREAVGVLHDRDSFLNAVEDLMSAGFDRSDLSLLAGERAIGEKLGHTYTKVQELEDDAAVPRVAFVGDHSLAEAKTGVIGGLAYIGATAAAGAVVASGGALAAAIAAAVAVGGGGGLLGAWAARYVGRDRARQLQHQLDHGGLLLWVHVRDEAHEKRAVDILKNDGAEDVHVHDLPGARDPASNPLLGLEIDPFLPEARF